MGHYFDLRTKKNEKAIIGYMDSTPNLYSDNATTTSTKKARYTHYIPHNPAETAPQHRPGYWGADLNARMYERSLLNSTKEHQRAHCHRRQGLVNLISQNIPCGNDPYLKRV